MPQSKTRSTSNAISFPAIRSALSEAKRFRIGGRQLRPEQERALDFSFGRRQVHVTTPSLPLTFTNTSSKCHVWMYMDPARLQQPA
jgi:hypothetical protein